MYLFLLLRQRHCWKYIKPLWFITFQNLLDPYQASSEVAEDAEVLEVGLAVIRS